MFTTNFRNQVQEHVLHMAASDPRITAGAVVGSLALSDGDRWSDLDLTFGVADEFALTGVLADWTRALVEPFGAAHLFDVTSGPSIYRVFLLPGCLQFDLSFTPAAKFGAAGPKFRLLFGSAVQRPFVQPPDARELFGYAVHHALRARFSIERGRYWLAEYWVSSTRDYALSLTCLRLGLPGAYGRGYDDLPGEILAGFEGALPASLDPGELRRALACAIDGLLAQAGEVTELAAQVEPQLRLLKTDF